MSAHAVVELEPIERASVDELRALQVERLRATVRRAYENVRFYREAFAERGVCPGDLRELEDLARFPFLLKRHFREQYPFGLFAVPREQIARLHASSGTTGKPTIVGYTANDVGTWANLMARSIRAAGGRPGDVVQVSYGYGLFTGGLGAHYGAERLGCTVVPMSGGQTEKQVQLINDLRPRIIMVTPTYMLAIAEEMIRQGIVPQTCSLEIGIFGAEPWTNDLRAQIEARLGLNALDIYGLSEVMGPGVAQECAETKDGLTLWEDHFYPEIIDPETEAVLPEGEFGELVLTSLTKEALPVIRYRTRDLTRLLPGTARPMRRLERITGRSDDMMIVRGVNVFPSQIEELILRDPRLSPHYQIRLRRSGPLDEATVVVEALADTSAELRRLCAQELARVIKHWIGVTVDVEVVECNTVPRSMGKAARVIDERKR
jgi:phenylacetate-CoA ligase